MSRIPREGVAVPRIWDDLLSDLDREIYREAGYGEVGGGGTKPALLVIDVTYEFVGDKPEPIMDSIKKFGNSCGAPGWERMEKIRELLDICRPAGIPIFYSKGMDERSATTRGAWSWKKSPRVEQRTAERNLLGNTIPDLIAPQPGEVVIQKTKPSAFFGTPLASYLTHLGVDTVVVTGTTTSGCIRATVLDSFSLNLKSIVVEEAVFDRCDVSHRINLFDMNAKYADVISLDDTKKYLRGIAGNDLASAPGSTARP
jgi:maleamate amidohydrolase